ncbi:tyrosine-type recombinase/integrase [Pseudomonas sp. NPDC089396]|uniref:tyrosine-type recombinase/integrase n=1 Tax=Pseudomonas sp. NPDC089396 TaxID=3364461 RepID=UPI003839AFF6
MGQSKRFSLTVKRINDLLPPAVVGGQDFYWSASQAGLAVRVTAGKKAFIWQGRYLGKVVRITIGDWPGKSIADAEVVARRFQAELDAGRDPRQLKKDNEAAAAAASEQARLEAVTLGQAWANYLKDRQPHWGDTHYQDHLKLAQAGGEKRKRGAGKTVAGPLHALMLLPLSELSGEALERWATKEGATRPTRARLAMRCLKAFLRWAADEPEYRAVVAGDQAITKRARERLGRAEAKQGCLLKEQLPAWFAAVRGLDNPVIAAYLQSLLLIGSRPGELLDLKWSDIDWKWSSLTIRDKDASKGGRDGTRTIPLTPYVERLLTGLPTRNQWVFSSPTSKSGRISEVNHALDRACSVAGVEVTPHDLRRSFVSLSEWLELPSGVIAQIGGHKPSATQERHYKVRPLDLLRLHHERFEVWMLEQAGVPLPVIEGSRLRAVQ